MTVTFSELFNAFGPEMLKTNITENEEETNTSNDIEDILERQ
jgi:hypothetical protein